MGAPPCRSGPFGVRQTLRERLKRLRAEPMPVMAVSEWITRVALPVSTRNLLSTELSA